MNGSQAIDYLIPIISQMFIGPLMLVISIVFWKFPPKTINNLYGYRTNRSMLNQENWDFANKEFAKMFMIGNIFTIITQIAATLIYDHLTGIACGIFCLLSMFIVSFVRVEGGLKKLTKE